MAARAKPAQLKRGRKPPPPGETARERFIRVGTARVTNAVYAIRLIGNLARGAYEWDDRDISMIQDRLYKAIDDVVRDFAHARAPKQKRPDDFTFVGPARR